MLTNPLAPAYKFHSAELQPKAADPGWIHRLDLLPMLDWTPRAAGRVQEEEQLPGLDSCEAKAVRRGSYIQERRGGQD